MSCDLGGYFTELFAGNFFPLFVSQSCWWLFLTGFLSRFIVVGISRGTSSLGFRAIALVGEYVFTFFGPN